MATTSNVKSTRTARTASRSHQAGGANSVLRLVKNIRGVSATDGQPLEFTIDGNAYWMVIPRNFTQAHYAKLTGILAKLVQGGAASKAA